MLSIPLVGVLQANVGSIYFVCDNMNGMSAHAGVYSAGVDAFGIDHKKIAID